MINLQLLHTATKSQSSPKLLSSCLANPRHYTHKTLSVFHVAFLLVSFLYNHTLFDPDPSCCWRDQPLFVEYSIQFVWLHLKILPRTSKKTKRKSIKSAYKKPNNQCVIKFTARTIRFAFSSGKTSNQGQTKIKLVYLDGEKVDLMSHYSNRLTF